MRRTQHHGTRSIHLVEVVDGEGQIRNVHHHQDVSRAQAGRTHTQIPHGAQRYFRTCFSTGTPPALHLTAKPSGGDTHEP